MIRRSILLSACYCSNARLCWGALGQWWGALGQWWGALGQLWGALGQWWGALRQWWGLFILAYIAAI